MSNPPSLRCFRYQQQGQQRRRQEGQQGKQQRQQHTVDSGLIFSSNRPTPSMWCACGCPQEKKKVDPNATLQVTGAVAWRREGIKYKKNEVRGVCEVWGCVQSGSGSGNVQGWDGSLALTA